MELPPEYNFSQPSPEKKPWFKKPLFYTLLLTVLVVGYFAFRLGSIYHTISIDNRPWWKGFANVLNVNKERKVEDPNPLPQPEKDRLDVLILGIRGEDDIENGGLLTDTVMILSLDKVNKKAVMISVPRDFFVDMVTELSNGKQISVKGKLNEVYEKGLANREGVDFSKKIFSKITGVYIDKAIVFDFNAFKSIVDKLGGVDLTLAKPFEEKNQWGYPFYLPAGNNHLDGDQALYYVRSRYSTSDFDRSRRQQETIVAIKNKAAASGFLSNPLKIASLFSDLKGDVRTDFQIWDIKDLMTLANSISGKNQIKNYFITTENLLYESRSENGEYVLLPKGNNYDGLKRFFKEILL